MNNCKENLIAQGIDQIAIDDKNESRTNDVITTKENNNVFEIQGLAIVNNFTTDYFIKGDDKDITKTDREGKNEVAIGSQCGYRIERVYGNKYIVWNQKKKKLLNIFFLLFCNFEFRNHTKWMQIFLFYI